MGNQESIQKLATYDGIPALNASNLKKFRIPIPPLEIQREIVKILDTFTQLEAELEAELEARQKQYHYYRNQLLTFDNRDDVRWATLGEIGKVSMCKRIFKNETSSQGEIPFTKSGLSAERLMLLFRANSTRNTEAVIHSPRKAIF